jgi:quercetin dioxygenase-like cupin family protein
MKGRIEYLIGGIAYQVAEGSFLLFEANFHHL